MDNREISTMDKIIDTDANVAGCPAISVVTVNFNGGERTIRCIRALINQALALHKIIVVDNGSTDGSVDGIRSLFPQVEIIELGANKGISFARNIGLKHAETKVVLLIDYDLYVSEDSIIKMAQTYKKYQATAVCPRIVFFPECRNIQCDGAALHFIGTLMLRHAYQPVADTAEQVVPVRAIISACMLLDCEKVLNSGGFDETYFFYFEDLEFSYRLSALGHGIICDSRAVVYHDRGDGTPGLSFRGKGKYPDRRAYLIMRHRWLTILTHWRLRTMIVLIPALAIYEFACFVLVMQRGWIRQWHRALRWQIDNLASIRQKRRQIERDRAFADKDLLEGGPLPFSSGFVRSGMANFAVTAISQILNLYWRFARRWIA
jgi:GT2 family glycosyltransferase